MPIIAKKKREQLIREGYCIFENVLPPEMVAKLNAMSEWTIAREDPAHFDQHRAQGCIIPYWRFPHPAFAGLVRIAHPTKRRFCGSSYLESPTPVCDSLVDLRSTQPTGYSQFHSYLHTFRQVGAVSNRTDETEKYRFG
jgi:hypothetical protein